MVYQDKITNPVIIYLYTTYGDIKVSLLLSLYFALYNLLSK